MGSSEVLFDSHDAVGIATINRSHKRNALSVEALYRLTEIITVASKKRSSRALVLEGAGDECFCAGMDLAAAHAGGAEVSRAVEAFHAALHAADRVPIVAAVRGMAVGGGFELMTRCDLVVASCQARFSLPEAGRGLVPGGGALLFPTRLPLAVALEMALLGDFWPAQRLLELGMINRIVRNEDVRDTAIDLASQLAELPPATTARIRYLLTLTATKGPAAAIQAMRELELTPELRAEANAGMAKFLSRH